VPTTCTPIDPGPRSARGHERAVKGCTACPLHESRGQPVVGDGPRDARLVIVTDVPRRHEDIHGHALAGSARNVLDEALLHVGIDPASVRRTSVGAVPAAGGPGADRGRGGDLLRAPAG
jgi:uracil-DNA glycosylase